jgi:hypothetical protein
MITCVEKSHEYTISFGQSPSQAEWFIYFVYCAIKMKTAQVLHCFFPHQDQFASDDWPVSPSLVH